MGWQVTGQPTAGSTGSLEDAVLGVQQYKGCLHEAALPSSCHLCPFRPGTQPGDQKERPGPWTPEEEARDRKANATENFLEVWTPELGLEGGRGEREELTSRWEEGQEQGHQESRPSAEP